MEIFGFVMLLLIACYAAASGIVMIFSTLGFTGKLSWEGLIIFLIGLYLLYVSWVYSPVSITVN